MIWFTNNDSYTTDKEWLWIQGYAGIGTNRTNKSISFNRDEKTIKYGSLFIKGY